MYLFGMKKIKHIFPLKLFIDFSILYYFLPQSCILLRWKKIQKSSTVDFKNIFHSSFDTEKDKVSRLSYYLGEGGAKSIQIKKSYNREVKYQRLSVRCRPCQIIVTKYNTQLKKCPPETDKNNLFNH